MSERVTNLVAEPGERVEVRLVPSQDVWHKATVSNATTYWADGQTRYQVDVEGDPYISRSVAGADIRKPQQP